MCNRLASQNYVVNIVPFLRIDNSFSKERDFVRGLLFFEENIFKCTYEIIFELEKCNSSMLVSLPLEESGSVKAYFIYPKIKNYLFILLFNFGSSGFFFIPRRSKSCNINGDKISRSLGMKKILFHSNAHSDRNKE